MLQSERVAFTTQNGRSLQKKECDILRVFSERNFLSVNQKSLLLLHLIPGDCLPCRNPTDIILGEEGLYFRVEPSRKSVCGLSAGGAEFFTLNTTIFSKSLKPVFLYNFSHCYFHNQLFFFFFSCFTVLILHLLN